MVTIFVTRELENATYKVSSAPMDFPCHETPVANIGAVVGFSNSDSFRFLATPLPLIDWEEGGKRGTGWLRGRRRRRRPPAHAAAGRRRRRGDALRGAAQRRRRASSAVGRPVH